MNNSSVGWLSLCLWLPASTLSSALEITPAAVDIHPGIGDSLVTFSVALSGQKPNERLLDVYTGCSCLSHVIVASPENPDRSERIDFTYDFGSEIGNQRKIIDVTYMEGDVKLKASIIAAVHILSPLPLEKHAFTWDDQDSNAAQSLRVSVKSPYEVEAIAFDVMHDPDGLFAITEGHSGSQTTKTYSVTIKNTDLHAIHPNGSDYYAYALLTYHVKDKGAFMPRQERINLLLAKRP